MPKTKISEFSATPGNNTDIDGINIAEGCAPSGINDAIRELMSQLKDWQAGTSNDPMVIGSSGSLTLSYGTVNGVPYLNGSKVLTTGSALTFDGTNLTVTGFINNSTSATGNPSAFGATSNGDKFIAINSGAWKAAIGVNGAANMWQQSTDAFLWYLNTSEQMRLTSTGLGIGTSSPAARLHAYGTSGAVTVMAEGAVGSSAYGRLEMRGRPAGASQSAGYIVAASTAGGQAATNIGAIDIAQEGASGNASFMAFSTHNGTSLAEDMRLDSRGNLGLGVTPSAWGGGQVAFQVKNASLSGFSNSAYMMANTYYDGTNEKYIASSFAGKYAQASGAHIWYTAPSGTAGNAISFTQAMTLDASGNLLVGTTSAGAKFHVYGTGSTYAKIQSVNAATGAGLYFENNTRNWVIGAGPNSGGSEFQFYDVTASAERMRIDTSGNLLVGKTAISGATLGAELRADGSAWSAMSASANTTSTINVYSTGASAYRFYVGMGGTIYATSTTITAISDQRLKENIQDIDVGLDAVMALKPRKFDWKEGKGKNKKGDRGWIAQEFEQVFPDMIDQWRDPAPEGEEPYKAVNADLIPVLVKAIQEQQAIINQLTARIEALEQA